jgi:hypothetical protein
MIRIRRALGFSVSSVIERPLFRVAHLVLLFAIGTGRMTKHALNAGEHLFQRRAVGQFCSKPALNMWYGSRQPPPDIRRAGEDRCCIRST